MPSWLSPRRTSPLSSTSSLSTCVDVAVSRGSAILPYLWDDASGASASIRMSCCSVTPRLSGANVGALRTPSGSSTRSTTEKGRTLSPASAVNPALTKRLTSVSGPAVVPTSLVQCLRRRDFWRSHRVRERGLWNGVGDCFHDRKLWVVRCLVAGRQGFEPR